MASETSSSARKLPKRLVALPDRDPHVPTSLCSLGLKTFIANSVTDGEQREHERRGVRGDLVEARYCSSTWSVSVSVLPASLPETTATAPYSPSARAVVRTTP